MEGFLYGAWGASDVAVGGCLQVDGVAQLQAVFDGVGAHVEYLGYDSGDFAVGHVDFGCAAGVDVEAYGLGHADGVGYLHEGF